MKRSTALMLMIGCLVLVTTVTLAGDGQIDIATLPYTISQPGSYVVVKDLTLSTTGADGITITANNVTLDLNGHTLTGPGKYAGSYDRGITVPGYLTNVEVRNGTVRNWPNNRSGF